MKEDLSMFEPECSAPACWYRELGCLNFGIAYQLLSIRGELIALPGMGFQSLRAAGPVMQKAKVTHIEDLVTARYQLADPDVARIRVRHGPAGWRCRSVWAYRGAPRLSKKKIAAILVDADKILTELLKEYHIDDADRPRVKTPVERAAQDEKRAADFRAEEERRRGAQLAKTSRLRAERMGKDALDRVAASTKLPK